MKYNLSFYLNSLYLFVIVIKFSFSEKNSAKVVKTWKTAFQNGFENWTVEKDSPWIIEKWEVLRAKYNQSRLQLPARIPNNDHIIEGTEKKETKEVCAC